MISIVIPLYNKEKSIVRTLDSVLAQTNTDYECLIVNDGSTDESADVVCDVICKMGNGMREKFRLIEKENGGVSSARNCGVQEAKGEYVAFLDGDDLWEPTFLDEMQRLIADFPKAAIYGVGLGKIYGNSKIDSPEFLKSDFRGVVTELWSDSRKMLSWTGSSTCLPISVAHNTLANEALTHGEDLDVWLRAMLQGNAVFYNKTLAYYVQDAENRAMNRVPPIDHHIVSVIDRYWEAREANAEFRKAFDTQMAYFLYEYMFTEYKDEAKRLAKMLDYSQLKKSIWFRLNYPRVYRFLKR